MNFKNLDTTAGIVFFIIFVFLLANPMPTIIVCAIVGFIIFIVWLVAKATPKDDGKTVNRKNALEVARIYLAPHESIWNNLKLSNKFCTLRLGRDGLTITATEKKKNKNEPYRTFRVVQSKVHDAPDLWNLFCLHFDHLTSYDGLKELCVIFKVVAEEKVIGEEIAPRKPIDLQPEEINRNRVDINNASEIELTELPGISIVLAKKIIKRREEINGFKSLNEFFNFVNLKEHMQEQLKNLIEINKMKGSLKIERFQERNLDL